MAVLEAADILLRLVTVASGNVAVAVAGGAKCLVPSGNG